MDFVEETVTRRVAINDSTGEPLTLSQVQSGTAIARRPASYGGVMQMQDSLPRQGAVIQR